MIGELRKVLKLERTINLHGLPKKIAIDKRGANTAAIHSANVDACLDIELRQCKYLNNIVEQDHRAVKRITNLMLGLKSFWSARKLLAGIETFQITMKTYWMPDGRGPGR